MAVAAAVVAAVFAVLWLGMTLTAEPESLLIAVIKIVVPRAAKLSRKKVAVATPRTTPDPKGKWKSL